MWRSADAGPLLYHTPNKYFWCAMHVKGCGCTYRGMQILYNDIITNNNNNIDNDIIGTQIYMLAGNKSAHNLHHLFT